MPLCGGPRQQHQAFLLNDGSVLITGGTDQGLLNYAERYIASEPQTVRSQPMSVPRAGHTATLLPDGRGLIVGGTTDNAAGELLPDPQHRGDIHIGAVNYWREADASIAPMTIGSISLMATSFAAKSDLMPSG